MTGEMQAASEEAGAEKEASKWVLRLYVAGQTPNCVKAFANLSRICIRDRLSDR